MEVESIILSAFALLCLWYALYCRFRLRELTKGIVGSRLQAADEPGHSLAHSQILALEEDRQALVAAKDQFLESISHELRTPLTGLEAALEFLAQDVAESSGNEWLLMAKDAAERLSRIVESSECLVRSHLAGFHAATVRLPLCGVLRDVWERIQDVARQHDQTCRIVWPRAELQVAARAPDLQNLLEHLLRNALNFGSSSGVVTLLCTVVKRQTLEDLLLFEVLDEGEGIPQAERARIFEAFHQLRGPADEKPSGLGLGLSICRAIALSFDSDIEVHDRQHKGSCFSLKLPCFFAEEGARDANHGERLRVLQTKSVPPAQVSKTPSGIVRALAGSSSRQGATGTYPGDGR